jgi:hypothetical protein
MMTAVKVAGDVMRGLSGVLVCAGAVSNLIVVSQTWGEYQGMPWRARFVALNRRHPRLRGTALVCLAVAIVLYVAAAVMYFA